MLAVLGGVGFAGWQGWQAYGAYESRQKIDAACAGLVDPGRVMDLRGGGFVHVTAADKGIPTMGGPDDQSFPEAPNFPDGFPVGSCAIYRGSEGDNDSHFTLRVSWEPDGPFGNVVSGRSLTTDPLFHESEGRPDRDPTRRLDAALPQPLGNGAHGTYTEDGATLTTPCPGRVKDERALRVETTAPPRDERPHGAGVTDADRGELAALARQATQRVAAELGCHIPALPKTPRRLDAPRMTLGDARKEKGTCAWYGRFAHEKGRSELPDRAIGSTPDDAAPEESCVLGVGPSRMAGVSARHGEDVDRDSRRDAWGVRFDTFRGDEARDVTIEDYGEDQRKLKPGDAGKIPGGSVRWASSTCHGDVAVHTMSADMVYAGYVEDRLDQLFAAYVQDAAKKRGCTEVTLPGKGDGGR